MLDLNRGVSRPLPCFRNGQVREVAVEVAEQLREFEAELMRDGHRIGEVVVPDGLLDGLQERFVLVGCGVANVRAEVRDALAIPGLETELDVVGKKMQRPTEFGVCGLSAEDMEEGCRSDREIVQVP